ncbi:MAG: hypothetical protein OXC13_16850 [Caldilineaceae bacterium]|nr:hypothetical protein [Caldilineaceae bacterium]
MNEVHLTGVITTVWQYEGDTYLRIQLDRHRHSVGGRRQDRIAVRVPPHVGIRTPLETGRHLSFHGYLEAEANGTVEEDLRRRLPAREEQRLVAERIEDLPSPRRNPNTRNGARPARTRTGATRRPAPAAREPADASGAAAPATRNGDAPEPVPAAAEPRTGETRAGATEAQTIGSDPPTEGDPNGGPVETGSVGPPAPEDPEPDA